MSLVKKCSILCFFLIYIVYVNSTISDHSLRYDNFKHEFFGGFDYDSVLIYAPVSDIVENELCRNHSEQFLTGVRNKKLWALKMVDATTKDADGLRVASLTQMGNYDECLSVKTGAFSGRHCLVSLGPSSTFSEVEQRARTIEGSLNRVGERLDAVLGDNNAVISVMGATIGVCIPSSCTSHDLERHLRNEMRSTNISVRVNELSCSSSVDKIELQTSDWCAIILIACFVVIIAGSTFYDLAYTTSGSLHELITAFSVYSNGRKLLKVAPPSAENITPLNGIRVLSMMWVLMIHSVLLAVVTPTKNFTLKEDSFYELRYVVFTNGTLCIEPFLLISGLLVCYNFMKERDKGVTFNPFSYYFHRYIRLTPPYAAMMLLIATLVNYSGDGPWWKTNMAATREGCEKYWMFGLLYVNNYYPQEKMCMGRLGESWYLAVDMQLFVLSPLILIPLWRWPRVGKALLGITITAGLIIACAVPYINQFPFTRLAGNSISSYSQYFTTHTRFTPWLLGLCLGYVLHMTKHKVLKLSPALVIGGWILGLLVMNLALLLAYFFLQKDYVYNTLATSLYTGLNRPGFALGIAWIVFACAKGYGGKLNAFLSCWVMQVLSRLTYTVYLTHLTVLTYTYASIRTPQYSSDFTLIHDYISNFIICFAVALVLHLVVEAPILNLERVLMNKPTSHEVKKQHETTAAESYKFRIQEEQAN